MGEHISWSMFNGYKFSIDGLNENIQHLSLTVSLIVGETNMKGVKFDEFRRSTVAYILKTTRHGK